MRYSVFSDKALPVLSINNIGYGKNPEITRFGPGRRKEYIIHYILSGEGYFNGNKVTDGKGFLITPESYEYYYPSKDNPWEFIWVTTDDEKMKSLFSYYKADEKSGIFEFELTEDFTEAKSYLIKNKNRVINSGEMLELFFKLFKGILKSEEKLKVKSISENYVEFAVKYIENNCHRELTVSEITEVLGVSQPYLFKIFKENIGKSPKEFITGVKIKAAKRLLSETNLLVSEVAASVGFSDALAFSKSFSKKTGVSPTKYRNDKARD